MAPRVVTDELTTYGDPINVGRVLSYTESPRIDLVLPVMTVEYYRLFPEPSVAEALFSNIRANGILSPLRIYTNGVQGVLRDGHHRLYVARMLGFETVPVHVIPNWLEKLYVGYGLPTLEPLLTDWLATHPDFTHQSHIQRWNPCNPRMSQVSCSCGATWREVAMIAADLSDSD